MVVYEQDPDVLRWSLHLLLPPAAALHYQQRTSGVDCDEMIAHALQEELSYAQSQSLSSSILHLPPSGIPSSLSSALVHYSINLSCFSYSSSTKGRRTR